MSSNIMQSIERDSDDDRAHRKSKKTTKPHKTKRSRNLASCDELKSSKEARRSDPQEQMSLQQQEERLRDLLRRQRAAQELIDERGDQGPYAKASKTYWTDVAERETTEKIRRARTKAERHVAAVELSRGQYVPSDVENLPGLREELGLPKKRQLVDFRSVEDEDDEEEEEASDEEMTLPNKRAKLTPPRRSGAKLLPESKAPYDLRTTIISSSPGGSKTWSGRQHKVEEGGGDDHEE